MDNNNQDGFTLIELMVAVALVGIVIAGLVSSFSDQSDSRSSQKQVVDMQQSARSGLFLMVDQIRMAGFDPHGKYDAGITSAGNGIAVGETYTPPGGAAPVNGTGPLTFTLVADKDTLDNNNDGTVNEEGELKTVSFYRDDADSDGDDDIVRDLGDGNPQILIENIQNIVFSYLDGEGNLTVDVEEISGVHIDLTVQVDGSATDYTLGHATRSIPTMVHCRNLNL